MNLNRIKNSIPGGRTAVNNYATKNVQAISQAAASSDNSFVQSGVSRLNNAGENYKGAMKWARGKLGYSTEEIGSAETKKFPNVTLEIPQKNVPRDNLGGIDPHKDLKSQLKEYTFPPTHHGTIGDYGFTNMSGVGNFMANYLNNSAFGDPLTSNRFLVSIPYINYDNELYKSYGAPRKELQKNIIMFACRTASFPGRQISTYQYTTHGTENDYPYNATYENIDLTFLCTAVSAEERRWFDAWMSQVVNPETMEVGYKNDFAFDISIGIFNMNNLKIIEAELKNAYPVGMSAMELGHESDEVLTFTVSFAYDRWKYKEILEYDGPRDEFDF